MSFVNVFGGTTIQPADISYTLILLTANTTLSWPTQFPDPNSLLFQITTAQIMDVLPSASGFTLTLPPANQVSVGQSILINNISGTQSFTLLKNDGSTLTVFAAQTIFYLYLINNTTVGGTWRITPWGLGLGSTVTSVGAVAATAGLTIIGSPITTAGTFTFSLSPNLVAVSNIATTGIQVVTNNAPATWVSRSLTAGANINITNPDGVAGNPIIALSTSITGVTSITSGNVQISGQTITTTNGNQDLILAANGTGTIQLANNLDANGNSITGVSTITSTSIQGGNLILSGNALSATNTNGSIQLNPDGVGTIILGTNVVSSPFIDAAGNFSRLTTVNSNFLNATNSVNTSLLTLTGNIIQTLNNVDILLSPNGTGNVVLSSNLNMQGNNIINVGTLSATSLSINSLSVQANPIPIARASVSFDGIPATPTILTSVNITPPIIKISPGVYQINFGYVFPSAFYTVLVSSAAGAANYLNATATSVQIALTPAVDSIVSLVIFY